MFEFLLSETARLANAVVVGDRMTDEQFIETEIRHFKVSQRRKAMIDGKRYYQGKHDILSRERTCIGDDGELMTIENLPNNKVVDNQYKKMVNQKTNYLVGKPFSIDCENEQYTSLLRKLFNKKFRKTLKGIVKDVLNCGIGWVFINYDEQGKLVFKKFEPFEVIAGWKDAEHTVLDYAIRIYEVIAYEGKQEKVVEKVEVYDDKGITFFELSSGGTLTPVAPYFQNYFTAISPDGVETGYNWTKIPLVAFKYNEEEIPLIKMVKSLQDGLNIIESNFQNQMEEDPRNTILVLVNYDGQKLGEFRKNLAQYGAVKVKTVDGAGGDVRTLQVEVNSENYKTIIEIFKKAIIENAMGYDAKDDRMSGNPNQMNIQSMYSDIDLDANDMETELQASFEELLWFINCHFANVGLGDFEDEEVDIIFDRDMLMNEGEVITQCQTSVGILSDETIVANHPWVDDPAKEMERLKKQKEEAMNEMYQGAFNPMVQNAPEEEESED